MSVTTVVITAAAAVLALFAELLHQLRIQRVRRLAFGPTGRPRRRRGAAPAHGGGTAGDGTRDPHVGRRSEEHRITERAGGLQSRFVLVLDVSPSMRLSDAAARRPAAHRARPVEAHLHVRSRRVGQYKIARGDLHRGDARGRSTRPTPRSRWRRARRPAPCTSRSSRGRRAVRPAHRGGGAHRRPAAGQQHDRRDVVDEAHLAHGHAEAAAALDQRGARHRCG